FAGTRRRTDGFRSRDRPVVDRVCAFGGYEMERKAAVVLGMLLAAAAACGGAGGYGTSPNNTTPGGSGQGVNTNVINLADQTFSPTTVDVPAGTKVTWLWSACSGSGGY